LTKDLRLIYTAVDERAAGAAMDAFAEKWSARCPSIETDRQFGGGAAKRPPPAAAQHDPAGGLDRHDPWPGPPDRPAQRGPRSP
jgi:hypothetical protein